MVDMSNSASNTVELTTTFGFIVHSPFILMFVVGLLGGWLSWLNADYNQKFCYRRLARNLVTGVLATFMVPLFLQMIGSNLLSEISPKYQQFYVFLGMCSAAAFVSQKFASSISDQLLRKANDKAEHAEQTAREASDQTMIIANEHLMLQGSVLMLRKQFNEALVYIDKYLKRIPNDSNVLWRKAYCLKRMEDNKGALYFINQAIKCAERPQGMLFFNKACYMSLLDQDVSEIIQNLDKAIELDPEAAKKAILKDLKEDFKDVKSNPKFVDFLRTHELS